MKYLRPFIALYCVVIVVIAIQFTPKALVGLLAIPVLVLAFLPALLAYHRRHPHEKPILVLNILNIAVSAMPVLSLLSDGHTSASDRVVFNLLSWGTWIVALVWCFVPVKRDEAPALQPQPAPR
jgi:quinol-cytochrome oxidoreductase complex cytochrome b subunit